jgi:hypothetical protein
MSTVDDLAWKIIRSCGLSTGNSDINVFALQEAIKEMLKPRELTDEEIDEVWVETCSDFKLIENGKTKGIINIYDVSRAILKKASDK